jgi:ParB family chromosome partitioning protein
MGRDRRLVEEFIFRDEEETKPTTTMPLASVVLPPQELRYYIDEEEVEKIVATARINGIIQPLLVRPVPGSERYEVVAGAKRYRAAQRLELVEIPVVIRQLSDEDALEIALIENFARSGLTDLEEADGVLKLLSLKLKIPMVDVPPLLHRIQNQLRSRLTNNVIGEAVIQTVQNVLTDLGNIKLDSFISNRLPLLNLPDDILTALRMGKLESSKAKVIARVQDKGKRTELIEQAIAQNLSLSEIKEQVKAFQQRTEQKSEAESPPLGKRVDDVYRRFKKAKVWDDPKKQKQIEKLLAQMEALIGDG